MNIRIFFNFLLLCSLGLCSCYTVTEDMMFNERKLIPLTKQFHFEEVTYTVDDTIAISGWMLTKDSAVATVLLLHGNSNNLYESPWINIINTLGRLNVNVFAIDYRGFGRSSGNVSFRGLFLDAQQALIYLKSTISGRTPIIVYGLSLGSIPAADIGQNPNVSGLILEGAISSSQDALDATVQNHWFLHFIKIKYDTTLVFDSIEKMKNVKVPVLVIHGNRDQLPAWMSEKLYNAVRHSKKYFYSVENGHHCDTYKVDTANYFRKLNEFFNECIVTMQKN